MLCLSKNCNLDSNHPVPHCSVFDEFNSYVKLNLPFISRPFMGINCIAITEVQIQGFDEALTNLSLDVTPAEGLVP